MARPKKVIDEAEVARLAFEGASDREIGDILGCDHKTVASRFSPILRKKRAERRMQLRRWQTDAASEKVPSILIWLGKQELDQTEKVETKVDATIRPRLTIPATDDRPGPHETGGCEAEAGP